MTTTTKRANQLKVGDVFEFENMRWFTVTGIFVLKCGSILFRLSKLMNMGDKNNVSVGYFNTTLHKMKLVEVLTP